MMTLSQAKTFTGTFQLAADHIDLDSSDPNWLSRVTDQSGYYAWSILDGSRRLLVYIGRAKAAGGIRRRCKDYTRHFTKSSPDDSKIRSFYKASKVELSCPNWQLFTLEGTGCPTEEKQLIQRFSPSLNGVRFDREDLDQLEALYHRAYGKVFSKAFR